MNCQIFIELQTEIASVLLLSVIMSIIDRNIERDPGVQHDELNHKFEDSIEESAMRMAQEIVANLVDFVEGKQASFYAVFVSDCGDWATQPKDNHSSLHGLAFERLYAFTESRISKTDDGGKIISMRIPTSSGIEERELDYVEHAHPSGDIYQVEIISSRLNPSAEA